jgi:hypothetical protein
MFYLDMKVIPMKGPRIIIPSYTWAHPLFFWSVLFWNLCIGEYHLCKESDKFLLFEPIADQEELVGWCRDQGYKGKVQAIQV